LRRSDLQIASFSSRGPTLVDGVVKPDLLAPGNKIITTCTLNSATMTSQELPAAIMPLSSRQGIPRMYCQLSGTSFATPVVSGVAALMIQANPSLTPRQIKALLRITAQQLPSLSSASPIVKLLTEGAGLVNAYAAVRLAQDCRGDANTAPSGTDLLQ